jgi:hypothetical protein
MLLLFSDFILAFQRDREHGKYRFTPASRAYPGVSTNETNQNYDAYVIGDVTAPFAERMEGQFQAAHLIQYLQRLCSSAKNGSFTSHWR